MDDAKVKEKLDLYHQKVTELDALQIKGDLASLNAQIDPNDIPVLSFGLINELKDAVVHWPSKRELNFEGKIYRSYSSALVDLEGDSKLIFAEVKLIFDKPEDTFPIAVSLADTKPDENGTLRERHFSAKYYSDTTGEVQYVEFPYRQKDSGRPTINTKAVVIVARRMIQQLPQPE